MERFNRYLQFLCNELKHRLSASENEERAAQWIFSVLKKTGLQPMLESFPAPSSGYSIYQFFFLAGLMISFFYTQLDISVKLFLVIIEGLLIYLYYRESRFQHTFLYEWLRTRKSQNVYAEILPGTEQKKQIIIIAHYDSASDNVLFYPPWVKYLPLLVRISFYSFVSLFLISVLLFFWFHSCIHYFFLLLSFFYMACFLICFYSEYGASCTQGVNNNASSVALLLNIAEYFKDRQPGNSRLTVLFTGAKENGCSGIYEFLKQRDDLYPDQKTSFIVLECTGKGHPVLFSSEGMIRKYYPDKSLYKSARNTADRQAFKVGEIDLSAGYTELEVIRNFNLKGLTVGAREQNPDEHQLNDTLDHLQDQCLKEVYLFLCDLIKDLDQEPDSVEKAGIS